MSEEQNDSKISSVEVENNNRQLALAIQIARQAVINLKIPEFTGRGGFVNQRWNVFYLDKGNDISLGVEFNPPITSSMLYTSLGHVAWRMLREINLLLSNSEVLNSLGVEELDRESTIYDKTLVLTTDYIVRLPMVIYHSFHQTVNEVLVSHVKKFVEYDLREHWESLGFPKDYSLVPENNLNNLVKLFPEVSFELIPHLEIIDEEFSAYRKAAFSDRKIWLTPQVFSKLPDDYEQFQIQYKKARKEHNSLKKAYFKVNRRATFEDWDKHWVETSSQDFPNLFLAHETQNYTPSQLAYRHLAQSFGFSADYMEKLVINARKQAKDKLSQTKIPDI